MILAHRVNSYISAIGPAMLCDACIAHALGISAQQANRVTMALGTTSDFNRRMGVCRGCGREQKVIGAVG